MAVLHNYRKTLSFQAGLAFGVFLLMILSGWLSTRLLHSFPALEPILRYAGAVYILYLAYGLLKASYSFAEASTRPLGFVHGLMLQVLNPKLVVYAFTLFAGFLSSVTTSFLALISVCAVLSAVSFCATSTWAFFGTGIRTYLHTPRLRIIVNIALSLLLVYTALTLVGIL
jgi:cysteine/O-acetylserine efflux protein